ncbi:hypothetical protein PVK06_016823 [Gossypium arboreum]|uniref:Uncharacterized protein n=1 Tax=Gossypium arboreum TaxID=29729 RepID=A0ABR0Q1Y5_GOSAR|nr:hypothetical protein PVK06_016823 [Gossypium arboreum]
MHGQLEVSGTGNQPSEMNLFADWFVDRQENLGKSGHAGASNSFDLNSPSGHGSSFPSDQGASPQQLFSLQEQLRLMNKQMTRQSDRFEQQVFQQELLRQNEDFRRKMLFYNSDL